MITIFGSINVDLITPVPHLPVRGETILGGNYVVVQGGKGANQALAAALGAEPGQRVSMVGTVGNDAWGSFALERLANAGVDLTLVETDDVHTACGFISVDPDGQTLITVSPGANMQTNASQLRGLSRGDWLVLQMEVPLEENWAVLRAAKAAGARSILNLAPAVPVDASVLGLLDVLVVNEVEAEMLAHHLSIPTSSYADIARSLARDFGLTCIVTLGASGSLAAEPSGKMEHVSSIPVSVVDTTGAGDAYVGYLAAALDRGTPLVDAMKIASVGASLSCEGKGAQSAYPSLAAIMARTGSLA